MSTRRFHSRRHRRGRHVDTVLGDHDSILDVLANLIGILTLVGALAAVATANTAVRIKTPLSRSTNKNFIVLQAANAGIWNLQPAKDALMQAQEERLAAMRACFRLSLFSIFSCMDAEEAMLRSRTIGQVTYTLVGDTVKLNRTSTPDQAIRSNQPSAELQTISSIVLQAKRQNKALFVLLEPSGFAAYRTVRKLTWENDVDLGWEPWGYGSTVYFGHGGRLMTIQ